MMDTGSESTKRFNDAVTRFAKAYAPVAAAQIHFQKENDPSSTSSASDNIKTQVAGLIARFITSDSLISVEEATVLGDGYPSLNFTAIAQALGGIRGGKIYDAVENVGAALHFDSQLPLIIRILAAFVGESGIVEFVSATKQLASAICELDGITPEEDERLVQFYADLDAAVAGNSSSGPPINSV